MDIREGDVGAILGWGFAPWSGGPLSWLDILGTAYATERCKELSSEYGNRFEPPALLLEMSRTGEEFYTRFGHSKLFENLWEAINNQNRQIQNFSRYNLC